MGDEIQELADTLDLEYWLDRQSLSFRKGHGRSGMQLNIRECPVCGDTRWRTYLNADSGLGNCFICNQKFSKLGFVHRALGHDPDDRKAWSATFKHIREVVTEMGWRPKRTTTVAVEYGKAKMPLSYPLPTPEGQNLQWLEDRGVDHDLTRFFHLRYSEFGTWQFQREDGSIGSQNFGERIIIPVFDLDGTFVTFQGRDITGTETSRKYLFPKGLPGTGRFLLNGQNTYGLKRLCVGEGAFDVISIKKAFDEEVSLRGVGAVGTFGKHLSYGAEDGNDQLGRFIQLKAGGLKEITIMWDGEHKALIAALESAELLVRVGFSVRIAVLPPDKDPNEVLPAVVREAFWHAKPYTKRLAVEWRLRSPYAGLK